MHVQEFIMHKFVISNDSLQYTNQILINVTKTKEKCNFITKLKCYFYLAYIFYFQSFDLIHTICAILPNNVMHRFS